MSKNLSTWFMNDPLVRVDDIRKYKDNLDDGVITWTVSNPEDSV